MWGWCNGNISISKIDDLSSNLSPRAFHSAVGKWFKPFDFQSSDLLTSNPVSTTNAL